MDSLRFFACPSKKRKPAASNTREFVFTFQRVLLLYSCRIDESSLVNLSTSWFNQWAQSLVRIKAEKGSNSRVLPLSPKAIEMLSLLPRTNRNPERKELIFANADDIRTWFFLQKRRIAQRQAFPNVMLIYFHYIQTLEGNDRTA